MENQMMAVVRLRGEPGLRFDRRDTLAMLRLNRTNHAVVIPNTGPYLGMLKKVKDVVTWGEIDNDTLEHLLRKRGRLRGGYPLTDEWVKENVDGAKDISELSTQIYSGELKMNSVDGLKPLFRLHPARKGHRRFKRGYNEGGALGFRGMNINELLIRMS